MQKNFIFAFLLLVTWVSGQTGRRLEILFLGDHGHHRPMERFPHLMSALGPEGINLTYTDQLGDLAADNLNRYDALIIYANWDSLPPHLERDLLAFVASGKGLLPIHSASWCFRNSEAYGRMVGGQFWKHGMDTIAADIVRPSHEAMMGQSAIRVWDETYLHQRLQPDNEVLMVRRIGPAQASDRPQSTTEPYTWTRQYGKGRVFYTAFGHDEHAWQDTAFLGLIRRGLHWVVSEEARAAHAARNPKPFTYREARLPNYEKRQGPQLLQDPLSPEESMKHLQVPVGFSLELFAAEPNVVHPIAFAWDERGRLFVLITRDYPNERKDAGGSDYILLCEDTDGDGKGDKFTRFAEGLSIPTGMVFSQGGLIVSQAPDMLFLQDTDGDDKADIRRVLFTGFGTFDTHAGPSNLHYGFDNWIWGSVGYSGFKGLVGGSDTLRFGQGFFRFKPDGSSMEFMTQTSNNTWGLGFNETGEVFGSTANNAHGWYMAIPNHYYPSAPGFDQGSRSTDTHKDMKTITPRVRQVDVFGGYTAAAGHNFYTARAFPRSYWNQVAFVAEPTGHVLHQNILTQKGSDFNDREGFNLLAGADEWFSPVFAQVGPDGAVWVADWYSFIIQHNPMPEGFTMGAGNAYETDLRDETHGRIYRVRYGQSPVAPFPILSRADAPELLRALRNDNMFWRMHAQRLLVERGLTDVVPQLLAILRDTTTDAIGIQPSAIHALWVLHGLNALKGEVLEQVLLAAQHPCAGVRRNLLRILPPSQETVAFILEKNLMKDVDPLVGLQAWLALSKVSLDKAGQDRVYQAIQSGKNAEDRWIPDALACIAARNKPLFDRLFQEQLKTKSRTLESPPSRHASHGIPNALGAEASRQRPSNAGGPDLTISQIRILPSRPSPRDRITVEVEVTNRGSQPIPPGKVVPLSLRFSGMGQVTDMVSQVFSSGIEPGQTVTISKNTNGPWSGNITFVGEFPGEYTLAVALDKGGTLPDSERANNTRIEKIAFIQTYSFPLLVLAKSVRSLASVQEVSQLITYLREATAWSEEDFSLMLKAVSEGWNYRRRVQVSSTDSLFLRLLMDRSSGIDQDRLTRLLEAMGVKSREEVMKADGQRIVIRTLREQMQYDRKAFEVAAGKPVEILFENTDAMPHNLLIGRPRSLERIGKAADRMIADSDAAARQYVPDIPEVLFHSPMLDPGQSTRITFTAPTRPGEYPFVCTFPGHWRLMQGIMTVK